MIICLLTIIASPDWAVNYPDSVMEASRKERRIEYGWNFELYGGIGLGRFENKQIGTEFSPGHTTTNLAFPAWNAGIGINYYFVPWMGIGVGAEYNNYISTSTIITAWTASGKDYQGDEYTLTTTPHDIKETQRIAMVEVPIGLKFRAMPSRVGFIGTIGAKLGFPLNSTYSLTNNGRLENSVNYPYWNLTMSNIPHVIENATISGVKGTNSSLKLLNYAAYAELGILIQLAQRVDLAISAFATYYINDVMKSHADSIPLSLADFYPAGEYPAPFSGKYEGILATNEVKELHPWSVGLKIGIQINANRTRAQREFDPSTYVPQPKQDTAVIIPIPDTIVIEPDTIIPIVEEDTIAYIPDTIIPEPVVIIVPEPEPVIEPEPEIETTPVPVVAKKLDEMLSKSVIFFPWDNAEPILEPDDLLVQVAEVLRNNPEQKVYVNGHACKIGKPEYNLRLAQRRADAIASRLRAMGVRDDQMIVKSYGSKHPYHYNGKHTERKDRRVEIIPVGLPQIIGVVETVRPGSRLAQIARRHYGEPQYWVFIYEANRDKLTNPDNIEIGTELFVPDLSERLEGLTKEQALEEAAKLKEKILAE